ncbi:MAG: hypothetical protein JWO08_1217 [Verrucomicrobiaceae bacterium]|nr:hypothetical protein [Verrucomicrobiaceae bacterium]
MLQRAVATSRVEAGGLPFHERFVRLALPPMNSLHFFASLGTFELLVIAVLLAIVAAPIGLVVYFVAKASKRRKASKAPPPLPPQM